MNNLFYLCFSINRIPDLTLSKYSVFDGSSVEDLMDKHGVFLRQLHRLGFESGVYFHLMYFYNPDSSAQKGQRLSIIFYATSSDKTKLEGIRAFINNSVLSTYYDFYCYEIARKISLSTRTDKNGGRFSVIKIENIAGCYKTYRLMDSDIPKVMESIASNTLGVCEIASDADVALSYNAIEADEYGRLISDKKFQYGAFLTKKDYSLPAQNRLSTDGAGEVSLYSIMEWTPCKDGRLYNVLKLMEGYNVCAVLRIDIFPVEHTQRIRQGLPYQEIRRRISDHTQGKDDNSENIVKSWDKYLSNLMKFPQFSANIVAFANERNIAVMLADSVAAEAVESGTYLVETIESYDGFDMYHSDFNILKVPKATDNYMAALLSLYTLEEIRPMFSFPILYPGENIECQKETDPVPFSETEKYKEILHLGVSENDYDVTFPIKLFDRHAFIAGVPGSGKTNTMLYLASSLWTKTKSKIPFLVLEPAKQEYRMLAYYEGMEDLCIFSPSADTKFPLHINPFEFPKGLTLAEHIANLNAVFAGAFELIPPSPFLIDSCIEKVYINKGWNTNERNMGKRLYPTMQELYDSLKIAVEESGYEGESKSNIRSVMEVRIGSLLRREIGNVYNVEESSIKPEEWIELPAIIELEALGEGPANFMSLLISTLIRETLKVKKLDSVTYDKSKKEVNHIIFYEEAHNLIGPTVDNPLGMTVDPKVSATKYLVKMLAEVRALNEGIVIADQLPTAMAPEVLKNTGLKIGHRITAQDDRTLLGGTMSASADQLEDQGIFETGQALIFYEGLQKPYKMRVNEWIQPEDENGNIIVASDDNLSKFLVNNLRYNSMLQKSASIMTRKLKVEFGNLHTKCRKLIKELDELLAQKKDISDKRSILCNQPFTEKNNINIKILSNHISEVEDELSNSMVRKLREICCEFCNLYYAYITLAQNYGEYTAEICIANIDEFANLFVLLKTLKDVSVLQNVIIESVNNVMGDIERYIDFQNYSKAGILHSHTEYDRLCVKLGWYQTNFIDCTLKKIEGESFGDLGMMSSVESVKEFSLMFDKFYDISIRYYLIANSLNGGNKSSQIYPLLLFKQLATNAMSFFSRYKNYTDDLKGFLVATKQMRAKLCTIVNYRNKDKASECFLYNDQEYEKYHRSLEVAAQLEIQGQRSVVAESAKTAILEFESNGMTATVCDVVRAGQKYLADFYRQDYVWSKTRLNLLKVCIELIEGLLGKHLEINEEFVKYTEISGFPTCFRSLSEDLHNKKLIDDAYFSRCKACILLMENKVVT